MNYGEAKEALRSSDLRPESMFGLLKAASIHVNDKETHAQGRDLVIRLLARQDLCGEFETKILTSLVRSVGLYPYMSEVLPHAEQDDRIAYELHRPDNMPEVFHSLQAKIYYQLRSGSNVVVSASTSVGKSLVIDAMIALGKFKKIVIVVPTLALIDETRKRLARRFRGICHLITHPTQVAMPGKMNIYILTQERVRHRIDLANVDFFVVDEFYKLDFRREEDKQRAIELNLAFHQLASTGAQFYMLGPNIEAVKGLDKYEIHFIPSEYSTVAVDVVQFNLPSRGDERTEKLVQLCSSLESPTLIYCQGPGTAGRLADILLRQVATAAVPACAEAATWVAANYHPEWIAAKALQHGIGLHHGAIPRALQQHMVRLFNEGAIKFLICTSTLVEGVNTAAENVIVYDRRRNKSLLDFFTYKNIQGRAGRMGRYFIGKVYVLEKAPADADVVVEYPVGTQDLDTPIGLLLQLDDEELTDLSKSRVAEALEGSFLSAETLRANGSLDPKVQNALGLRMWELMQEDSHLFAWRQIPQQPQLLMACELIMGHLSGPRYNNYGISSPSHLAWHLRAIERSNGIPAYLSDIAAGVLSYQNVSDKIDDALRIIRNVITFRFPQDLMVLNRIQAELSHRLNVATGDYGFYAEAIENLFMPPALAALEEYGLPIQLAKKLSASLYPHQDVEDVIAKLREFDIEGAQHLTSFERELLHAVQESL